jgi:2'-5' RNA ligase
VTAPRYAHDDYPEFEDVVGANPSQALLLPSLDSWDGRTVTASGLGGFDGTGDDMVAHTSPDAVGNTPPPADDYLHSICPVCGQLPCAMVVGGTPWCLRCAETRFGLKTAAVSLPMDPTPIKRTAAVRTAAFSDAMERTASWYDIQTKAKALRREGRVEILEVPTDTNPYLFARVAGDHGTYHVLNEKRGSRWGPWVCSCRWGSFSQWGPDGYRRAMSSPYLTRRCSHSLASTYEYQSRTMFGRTPRVGSVSRIAVNAADEVPPEPGQSPIPAGHVRLYHQTSAGNADSIRQHGLDVSRNHSETAGEPAGVWGSTRPFYGDASAPNGQATVEYHVPFEDLHGTGASGRPNRGETPEEYQASDRIVLHPRSIPPENIAAIHEGWHGHVRYMHDNGLTDEVKRGDFDHLADDPGYDKAIAHIKRTASSGSGIDYHQSGPGSGHYFEPDTEGDGPGWCAVCGHRGDVTSHPRRPIEGASHGDLVGRGLHLDLSDENGDHELAEKIWNHHPDAGRHLLKTIHDTGGGHAGEWWGRVGGEKGREDGFDTHELKSFGEGGENSEELMDKWHPHAHDPDDDHGGHGGLEVVMLAHNHKGWDPNRDNPSNPLMGSSYMDGESGKDMPLHSLHVNDGRGWRRLPMNKGATVTASLEPTALPDPSWLDREPHLNADGTPHSGVMIALPIPPEIGTQLLDEAGEGTVDLRDLHVTLAYCGKASEVDPHALHRAVTSVAALAPNEVTVTGYGTFEVDPEHNDGYSHAHVALVSVPGIDGYRQAVVDALAAEGITTSEQFGLQPHVTLRYAHEPLEGTVEGTGTPFPLEAVVAAHGSMWRHYPVSSPETMEHTGVSSEHHPGALTLYRGLHFKKKT